MTFLQQINKDKNNNIIIIYLIYAPQTQYVLHFTFDKKNFYYLCKNLNP